MASRNQQHDGRRKPTAIGIDFGTSKCCVAAVVDGRVKVLENEFGQRTTPSCVAFDSKQRLVGSDALNQAVVNCKNTVHAVKSTIGRTYDQVQRFPLHCSIKKALRTNEFDYVLNYRKRELLLKPEQIAAVLLGKMKDIAESTLGYPVDCAVISVPASFGNAQRIAIKTAAEVAGFEALQLINETTAAGIAFGDNRTDKSPVLILVVDFGAGKLDVSIMEVKEKSVKVVAAMGNPRLGGQNIDDRLFDHCANEIQKKYEFNVKQSEKAAVRLFLACEKTKKTLSLLPDATLSVESIVDGIDVNLPVSRKELESLAIVHIQHEILDTISRLLGQKRLQKSAIKRVVLVGGSTRIPAVRTVLGEYFGADKLDETVNKDEAVAQGAALRAASLVQDETWAEVSDVSSYEISVPRLSSYDGIIRRYSPLPHERTASLTIKFQNYSCQLYEKVFDDYGRSCRVPLCSIFLPGAYYGYPGRHVSVSATVDNSGIFTFGIDTNDAKAGDVARMFNFPHLDLANKFMVDENKFRIDIETERKRVDAEVKLESIGFELLRAFRGEVLVKYSPSYEIECLGKTCSNALEWAQKNAESASTDEISEKIAKLEKLKKKVEQLESAAQKKHEAFETYTDSLKAFTNDKSSLELQFKNSEKELNTSDRTQYRKLIDTAERQLSFVGDFRSLSLTKINEKIAQLDRVKEDIQVLFDSFEAKISERREAVRKEKLMEAVAQQLSSLDSLFSDVETLLCNHELHYYTHRNEIDPFKNNFLTIKQWRQNDTALVLEEISERVAEVERIKSNLEKLARVAHEIALEDGEVAENRTNALELNGQDHLLEDDSITHVQNKESYHENSCPWRLRLENTRNVENPIDVMNGRTGSERLPPTCSNVPSDVRSAPVTPDNATQDEKVPVDVRKMLSAAVVPIEEHKSHRSSSRSRQSDTVGKHLSSSQLRHEHGFAQMRDNITQSQPSDASNVTRSASRPRKPLQGESSESRVRNSSKDVGKEMRSRSTPRNPSENVRNCPPSWRTLHVSGDVQKEDRHASGDVQKEDRHASGDVQKEDRHASGDVQKEDRHASGNVQKEDRHVSGDVQKEDRSDPQSRESSKEASRRHRSRSGRHTEKEGDLGSTYGSGCSRARSRSKHKTERQPSASDGLHQQEDCHFRVSERPTEQQNDSHDLKENGHPRAMARVDMSQQPTSASLPSGSLLLMRNSSNEKNTTLPTKPMRVFSSQSSSSSNFQEPSSMNVKPKQILTGTQTDKAELDFSFYNEQKNSFQEKERKGCERMKELINHLETLGILLPFCNLLENVIKKPTTCTLCVSLRFICSAHMSEVNAEFRQLLYSLPRDLFKSPEINAVENDTVEMKDLSEPSRDVSHGADTQPSVSLPTADVAPIHSSDQKTKHLYTMDETDQSPSAKYPGFRHTTPVTQTSGLSPSGNQAYTPVHPSHRHSGAKDVHIRGGDPSPHVRRPLSAGSVSDKIAQFEELGTEKMDTS